MLRKFIFIIGFFSAGILAGCKNETTDLVSVIYKVPSIELIGSTVVSVPVGSVYTDQGAKLNDDDGTSRTIAFTTNPVNTATPGLYLVTYVQQSKSGVYDLEVTRYVAVTSVSNPIDYSGTYLRPATGISAFVTKVENGVYKVQNPGGAGVGTSVVVYFVEISTNNFVCPTQPTDAGPFAVNTIAFTSTGASWKVENAGYGTGLRTFVKQ